jgi:hypothetical protein
MVQNRWRYRKAERGELPLKALGGGETETKIGFEDGDPTNCGLENLVSL